MATALQNRGLTTVLNFVPDLGEVRTGAAVCSSVAIISSAAMENMYSNIVQVLRRRVKHATTAEFQG